MNKLLCISVLFLGLSGILSAQQQEAGQAQIQYKSESSFAPLLHSHGFGLDYRRGKHLTGFRKFMFEVEFVSMKHPKETKVQNPYFENSKGYPYGKLNSVGVLRPGVGLQNILYSKENKGAVEIRYSVFGGASLAFAKPVYLEILHPTFVPYEYDISTEKYDPDRHFTDNIYGKAPFSKGMDETKIYPGLYGKFAISVEHASESNSIRAIETGLALDVYPKAVPLMATKENKPYFFNLYVALFYGRKWF